MSERRGARSGQRSSGSRGKGGDLHAYLERIPAGRAPARPGSCHLGSNGRSSGPRSWYPWRELQKRRVGATVRLTPPACVPTMVGRATPSSWSPFLRVGARTLRTEQCAKSQCVYPVDIGRCGSPCLPARRSYGKHHRKADPGVLLGEADFPTYEPETGPTRTRWVPGPTVLYGEFDPGSGRTLAACLTHASRAGTSGGVTLLRGERRTGE